MPPDNIEYFYITYMYIKKNKWKIETKLISHDELEKYQNDKYRILNFSEQYERDR